MESISLTLSVLSLFLLMRERISSQSVLDILVSTDSDFCLNFFSLFFMSKKKYDFNYDPIFSISYFLNISASI